MNNVTHQIILVDKRSQREIGLKLGCSFTNRADAMREGLIAAMAASFERGERTGFKIREIRQ